MDNKQEEDLTYQHLEFLNQGNISQQLNCQLCEMIFNNPKRLLQCGHTFCSKCIQNPENNGNGIKFNSQCPICKHPFIKEHIQDDLIAKKIINDLRVCCKKEIDCQWMGSLQNHISHIQNNECFKQDGSKNESQEQEIIIDQ